MPIYEYCCESCKERFEELVMSAADESELVCPECSSAKIQRLISGFSFKSAGAEPGITGGSGKSCGPCTSTSCKSCG